MRREWSAWIKTRQWNEFEKLAKLEPSQMLADVVAELERGIDEKPDRRALRKIQYLLQRTGYRPTPIEIPEEEPAEIVKTHYEAALFVAPDAAGHSICLLGEEKSRRVRWLEAVTNPITGFETAQEFETTVAEAPQYLESLVHGRYRHWASSPVPLDFAKGRLNSALQRTGERIPTLIAFWKSSFEGVLEPRHPAEDLARTEVSADDLARVALTLEGSRDWRLELGAVAPTVERLAEVFEGAPETEDRRTQANEVMVESCQTIFTPEVILDHSIRLLDLAYLRNLRREADVSLLVSASDDLRTQGANSAYARALLDKTVSAFLVALRERNQPS